MFLPEFEDIRPFNDNEINAALNRLTSYPQFKSVLKFLYPEAEHSKIITLLNNIHTAADLQSKFMRKLVFDVVEKTSTGFSVSGIENLSPDIPYLFIANHRDIILDSAILQAVLNKNNFPTTEITFGSNLMSFPLIVDFGKANRMFKVNRGGSPREILTNSKILSAYIRHTITEKKASVWIAQRNGRTKDGDDKTEIALLKMLNMSGSKSINENYNELNIVPVTISYEIEPCCTEKVNEMYISSFKKYEKKPGEDISSILKGLTQNKGKIHLTFGKVLNNKNLELQNAIENAKELCLQIDNIIYKNFNLWPVNYIAFDLINENDEHSDKYSNKEKLEFIEYKNKVISEIDGDKVEIEKIFLSLYANPVVNRLT
jgi:hypothetical protein